MAEEELEEVVQDPDETEEEFQDPEVAARRAAAMAFVRRYGDPVLKSRATPVDRFDDALRAQVSRMGGIMGDAMGVGLAAPQLGVSQRLLVYRVGQDAPLIALANPEVEWRSDDDETLEGWAEWLARHIRKGIPVYAYFNNDVGGHAPRDAKRLRNAIMAHVGQDRQEGRERQDGKI